MSHHTPIYMCIHIYIYIYIYISTYIHMYIHIYYITYTGEAVSGYSLMGVRLATASGQWAEGGRVAGDVR